MNRLVAFFKRLFGKAVKEKPVVATPPVATPSMDAKDANFLAWQAYQEELKRTGKFPTSPAEPKPTMTTEEYQNLVGVKEKTYEEYLKEKGYSHEDLNKLPDDLVEKLMKGASQYASIKMEEVKARAHLIKELHDDALSLEK